MELVELENIWKEYDKKIADNTRLNKEILRRMLILKPERRLNWIKVKAGFNVSSPLIFFFLALITDVQFQMTVNFYIGLSLFIPVYFITYIWEIKYLVLLRRIDFSGATLTIKKNIAHMEKFKIKITRIRYILMPLAILGIFLIIPEKPIFNKEFIIFLVVTALVFLSSTYYTFKYSIKERFQKLNREIKEIENIERE